jgi:hypothetical protein
MNSSPLFNEVDLYVSQLFQEHPHPDLLYHNFEHTQRVVAHSMQIADHYPLSEAERFILYTAAYFHDTGHLLGVLEGHERVGVEIMRDFFKGLRGKADEGSQAGSVEAAKGSCEEGSPIGPDELLRIERCIMVTRWPVRPVKLLEKMICDADTFHLGTEEFMEMDGRVWDEMERRTGKVIEHRAERSLRFLEVHRFYTEYCQNLLNEGKQRNIERLRELLGK